MSGDYQLLLLIAGMHLIGLVGVGALLFFALRHDGNSPWPGESGSDDGWGNEPRRPTQPSDKPWGGLPLPDAEQSLVRLRDHHKLPELLPDHDRRPAREPEREPQRTPVYTP